MSNFLRGGVHLSVLRDVTVELAKNGAMGLPVVRARRLRRARTSDMATGRDAWLERYAFQALRALKPVLGSLDGRRVVEFGPGDYLTSGLTLIAAGASSYTAMDRFPGEYGSAAAKERYRSVREAWADFFPEHAWPQDLHVERFPEAYADRVTVEAASIEKTSVSGPFDVVCSFQVGEHVSDIAAFARLSRRLLADDGVAVHRVDFGPHGGWREYDEPLTFLRLSARVWHAMGSNRGTPNRHRAHEFDAAFAAAELEVTTSELEYFDPPTTPSTRASLAKRFQTMPTESLGIRAVTYVCRPAAGPPPIR